MIGSYEHVICQKCCKRRWPGLWTHVCMNFAFLRASLRYFWHCFFWKYLFFEFAFCSVIFHSFLHKKLRNDWRWFCACINYCILWCGITCAVRILLLISMLVCLLFFIICTITFSPYFLQHFCALLTCFWGSNSSLLRVLMFARLPRYHFLVLRNYSLQYFSSCCVLRLIYTLLSKDTCFVVIVKVLSIFLIWLVFACFDCKIGLLHQFVFARFDIFVCFLAVVFACPFDTFIHKPFACLNRSKLWLLLSLFGFLASPMLA